MATNLWPNADLEANIDDWTGDGGGSISHSTTQAWEETYSLGVAWTDGNYDGAISDTKSIIDASTQYTFSFYAYVEDADVDLRIVIRDQDSNTLAATTYSAHASGSWVRHDETFTTGVAATGINVLIRQQNTAVDTNFYIDAVMLETGESASAWVNYGDAAVELVIADASLALSADGSGSVDGLWDLGAYIYTFGSGIILEVGGVDVLLAIANASLALSSESPALGPALSIANASLALSSDSLDIDAGASIVVDANRIAKIIFVMQNG